MTLTHLIPHLFKPCPFGSGCIDCIYHPELCHVKDCARPREKHIKIEHNPKYPNSCGTSECLDHPGEALVRCETCGWVPLKECPEVDATVFGKKVRVYNNHNCGGNILYMLQGEPKQWYVRASALEE